MSHYAEVPSIMRGYLHARMEAASKAKRPKRLKQAAAIYGGSRRERAKSPPVRNIERTTVDAAAGEDRALSRMIGRADHAFLFHPFDERGRFIVADRQAALDVARRAVFVAQNDMDGAVVEIACFLGIHAARRRPVALLAVPVVVLGNRVEIFGLALGFEMRDDFFDLAVHDAR